MSEQDESVAALQRDSAARGRAHDGDFLVVERANPDAPRHRSLLGKFDRTTTPHHRTTTIALPTSNEWSSSSRGPMVCEQSRREMPMHLSCPPELRSTCG